MAFVLGDRPIQPLTAQQALRLLELETLPNRNSLESLHGMLTRGPTGTLQPLQVDVPPLDLRALFAGLR